MVKCSILQNFTVVIPLVTIFSFQHLHNKPIYCNALVTRYSFFQQGNDRYNKVFEKYNIDISNRFHHRYWTCIKNSNDDTSNQSDMNYFTNMSTRTVVLTKPMGIILEEDFEKAPGIITIAKIDPNGNTAQVASKLDVSIGDILLQVNGYKAAIMNSNEISKNTFSSLEQVMDIIIQSSFVNDDTDDIDKSKQIQLELGRIDQNNIIVRFSNGIQIATKSGTKLSSLAYKAMMPISYSCDSGGCGTCEQIMRVQKHQNNTSGALEDRYVRPCVARVPKGSKIISLFPSDRFEPDN